jgi:hypothetical protein
MVTVHAHPRVPRRSPPGAGIAAPSENPASAALFSSTGSDRVGDFWADPDRVPSGTRSMGRRASSGTTLRARPAALRCLLHAIHERDAGPHHREQVRPIEASPSSPCHIEELVGLERRVVRTPLSVPRSRQRRGFRRGDALFVLRPARSKVTTASTIRASTSGVSAPTSPTTKSLLAVKSFPGRA